MAYTIIGYNTAGSVSADRTSSVEAIKKAVEMIGTGMANVYVTDTVTGRVYQPEEFPLLLKAE